MKAKRSTDLFKEVITSENVLAMSEMVAICETKHLIRWVGQAMIDIHKSLLLDVFNKNECGYILTDSYDLVQQVAFLLCENFGKRLSDNHHIDKKGKTITIYMQACKEIAKITNLKCRRMKTDISYEAIPETSIVSIETEEDMDLDYEESYQIIENIISSLGLSDTHLAVLQCRLNGMSYPQIGKVIQRAASTVYDYLQTVQRRYLAIYG